jgi:hypothetical protein
MYVRWINRPRTKQGRPTVHWAAVLVENKWIDGRPIQQHVAYLGGITQADAKRSVEQRSQFWDKATELLDGLDRQLSVEQRRKIEVSLAARVPRPTGKELRAHSRARRVRNTMSLEDAVRADRIHDLEIEEEEEWERA